MAAPTRLGGRPTDQLPEVDDPGPNKSLIGAGAFLAVILVLALVVFTRGGDKATPVPAPTPAPPGGAPGPGQVLDTTVPTSPPPVRWDLYRTVALPYSDTAGPTRVDGPVAAGFAHTPTGALMASVHASYRSTVALDSEWQTVAATMIQAGPGRDALTRLRSQYPVTGPPSPGELLQIAGFRFVTYTPETAVIQTASRGVNGVLQMTTSTIAWDGADWKLVLQPDGSDSPTAQRLTDLDGFVVWGGV